MTNPKYKDEITLEEAVEEYTQDILEEINKDTKPTNLTIDHDAVESVLAHYMDKYETLVWYARKHHPTDAEFWDKVAPEIRKGAFDAMKEAEQKYPIEVAKLNGELPPELNHHEVPKELREKLTKAYVKPDWEHGFNSGCLAAFRFALTALDRGTYWNQEFEEWMPTGGIEDAIDLFPELDT